MRILLYFVYNTHLPPLHMSTMTTLLASGLFSIQLAGYSYVAML